MVNDTDGWVEAEGAVEAFSGADGRDGRLGDEASVDVDAACAAEQRILGRILDLCLGKS